MWKTKNLDDVVKIQNGNSIPVKEKETLYANSFEGLPYVATKDVGYDRVINYDNGIKIPPQFASKFRISEAGSTLVCAEGGSAGRKIAFSFNKCHFVNKLFSLYPRSKELDSRFIYYYTLSSEFQTQFKKSIHGLIGGVSLNKIKKFHISYPPLSEQQRIVAKLDAAFAEIHNVNFATNEMLNQINKLNNSFFEKIIRNHIPNSKKLKLIDVCSKITDGSHFSPKTSDKGYPYITVRDITNDEINFINCKFINKENFENLKKNGCSPRIDDILFSKDGTVGKVSIIKKDKKFVVLSSLAIITPNLSLIYPKYLFYYLKSERFISEAIGKKTGVAIKRIILKNLKNIEIIIPSLKEQKEIVYKLENIFEQIKLVSNSKSEKIKFLEKLKESVLSEKLNNKVA